MKISKIKNSRPGISVAENKNEESLSRQSLLYYAPVKDGKIRLESKDLEQHVTECNEKAMIFNYDFHGADIIALLFAFMVLYSGVVAVLTDK